MPAYRIAFITKNGSNPAYDGARIGASRVAERWGGAVTHTFPATPDHIGQQDALIQAALATRPAAMVLAPTHPTALDATLRAVQAAAIPLVCFVSTSERVQPACYVTADNHALAVGVAELLLARMQFRGRLAILEGSPDSVTSAPRTQGFLEAAARCPDVEVVALRTGRYLREPAQAAMAELLHAGPPPDGVLCANDHMAMGVLDALDAAGCTALVAGVNAMPEAVAALRAGRLVATAAYDAMQMGCIATEAAFRLLSGAAVPAQITLPAAVIHAGNCAAYERPYAQRDLPAWERAVTGG